MRLLLTAAALVLAACFEEPDYSGRLCDPASPCPMGFICGGDGRCARPGQLFPDASPGDAPLADGSGRVDAAADAEPSEAGPPDAQPLDGGAIDGGVRDAGVTAVVVSVERSEDDAMEGPPDDATLVAYSWASLYSPDHRGGLRFILPPDLGAGAQILSADLELYVDSDMEDQPDLDVRLEARASAPSFAAGTRNIGARTLVSGVVVPFTAGPLGAGWRITPSVAPLLEELRRQPGWTPGTAAVLVLAQRPGAATFFEFRQYDHPPAGDFAPRLRLSYVPR